MTGNIADSASSALASPSTSSAMIALPADFVFSYLLSSEVTEAVAIDVIVMHVTMIAAIICIIELTPLL